MLRAHVKQISRVDIPLVAMIIYLVGDVMDIIHYMGSENAGIQSMNDMVEEHFSDRVTCLTNKNLPVDSLLSHSNRDLLGVECMEPIFDCCHIRAEIW